MNYFIDCGINRGQSISAFKEYFFQGKKWHYLGYEPAIKGLNEESYQIKEMHKSISLNSKFYETFKVINKGVSPIKEKKFFWYFYGAGSTGNFMKVIRMFLKDLIRLRFKNALRIFKFKVMEFENILKVIENLKKKGSYICLKLDIEGHEFEILEKMLMANIFPDQLLIEYHSQKVNFPIERTKEIHKKLYDENIELFLWSADDVPPMQRLGRHLKSEDC